MFEILFTWIFNYIGQKTYPKNAKVNTGGDHWIELVYPKKLDNVLYYYQQIDQNQFGKWVPVNVWRTFPHEATYRGEYIDIVEMVNTHGSSNIEFELLMPISRHFGPLTYSDGEKTSMVCHIDESRYQVKDNYKITLVGSSHNGVFHGRDDFYILDFKSMIRQGMVNIRVKNVELDNDNAHR
jgi:hypothetical protein